MRKERHRAHIVATLHISSQFSEQPSDIVPLLKMRQLRLRDGGKLLKVTHFRNRAGLLDFKTHAISIRKE